MSGLVCPHCQQVIDLFKTGGGESLAREMNVPFLGRVPIDPQIVQCGDAGSPYVLRYAGSPAAQSMRCIVESILRPPTETGVASRSVITSLKESR